MKIKYTFILPLLVIFFTSHVFGQLKSFDLPEKEHTPHEYLQLENVPVIEISKVRSVSNNYIDNSDGNGIFIYPDMKITSRTPEGRPTFILFESASNPRLQNDDITSLSYVKDRLEKVFQTRLKGNFSKLISEESQAGVNHYKFQQIVDGIPIYSGEYFIHIKDGIPTAFNGNVYNINNLNGELSKVKDSDEIRTMLDNTHFANTTKLHNSPYILENTYELIYFPENVDDQSLDLAYMVKYQPRFDESYTYFIDAITGEILNSYSNICMLSHDHTIHSGPDADGPKSGTARDLNGVNRTVHYYEVSSIDYMIDASRDMYGGGAINPNDPQGAIWTIDGGNKYPGNSDFEARQITSTNGFVSAPDAVSAFYNASESYEYFLSTFGRNSIDGNKGSIISLINISDEDGKPFDNAFWNGAAMFYGSGNIAFDHLAKALDVGGHEMTHGVIQASSNLEYQDEPGALNESLADVFGVMIDRDNWQLGEDITKRSYIATGVLRDMADPHNGGSSLNDAGWQPAHMNEKYTGTQDNGGVHINSGIVNKACYLIGQEMPKSKVEQIFYCAMTKYLTRRSSFVDYRAACEQCASEQYGATEKTAVSNAFAAVGIGSGGSTNPEGTEFEPNKGDDLVINTLQSSTNILNGNGDVVVSDFTTSRPISKPSVSDDGSAIVFVDQQKRIYLKQVDWQQGVVIDEGQLAINDQNGNPVDMRNVCISPSKSRIAFVTDIAENYIYFYDFQKQQFNSIELYNPTFSEDVITGEVKYADAMTFNSSGEFIIYDSFNEIRTNTGENIQYWDISYATIFNNNANQWADLRIFSFFGSLPKGTSVGNPSLAKNTNDVMTLDVLQEDFFSTEYYIATAGLLNGEVSLIYNNTRVGYPSYSRLDDKIIFSADATSGGEINGIIPMAADRLTPNGEATGFAFGTWGNWFATGQRSLPTYEQKNIEGLKIYPNPAHEELRIELPSEFVNSSGLRVRIFSMNGSMVYTEDYSGNEISIKGIPPGVYNIVINNNILQSRSQFVKLR